MSLAGKRVWCFQCFFSVQYKKPFSVESIMIHEPSTATQTHSALRHGQLDVLVNVCKQSALPRQLLCHARLPAAVASGAGGAGVAGVASGPARFALAARLGGPRPQWAGGCAGGRLGHRKTLRVGLAVAAVAAVAVALAVHRGSGNTARTQGRVFVALVKIKRAGWGKGER